MTEQMPPSVYIDDEQNWQPVSGKKLKKMYEESFPTSSSVNDSSLNELTKYVEKKMFPSARAKKAPEVIDITDIDVGGVSPDVVVATPDAGVLSVEDQLLNDYLEMVDKISVDLQSQYNLSDDEMKDLKIWASDYVQAAVSKNMILTEQKLRVVLSFHVNFQGVTQQPPSQPQTPPQVQQPPSQPQTPTQPQQPPSQPQTPPQVQQPPSQPQPPIFSMPGFSKEQAIPVSEKEKADMDQVKVKMFKELKHKQGEYLRIQGEISKLEESNYQINEYTDKLDKKRLDHDDEYLKAYGDKCREYTLNIQKLRDLDRQLLRAKFVYEEIKAKWSVLKDSVEMGLPIAELAKEWGDEVEGRVEDKTRAKVFFKSTDGLSGHLKQLDISVAPGAEFGDVRILDSDLATEFNRYSANQMLQVENGKAVSDYDKRLVDKVFRLEFLSSMLDFSSLEDQDLAQGLDAKVLEIHQKISHKYNILLPTVRANVPLSFKAKKDEHVAMISPEYCQELYDYNYKNDPAVRDQLIGLNQEEGLVWVEASLYGQVLKDGTLTLKQLVAVKNRMNELISKYGFLSSWLRLDDRQWVEENYPYLTKGPQGLLQCQKLSAIKGKMLSLGDSPAAGIFEYSQKYYNLSDYSANVGEVKNWKEYAEQEKLARGFVGEFFKAFDSVYPVAQFSKERSDLEDALYFEVFGLLKLSGAQTEEDILSVLEDEKNKSGANAQVAGFYQMVIDFYNNYVKSQIIV